MTPNQVCVCHINGHMSRANWQFCVPSANRHTCETRINWRVIGRSIKGDFRCSCASLNLIELFQLPTPAKIHPARFPVHYIHRSSQAIQKFTNYFQMCGHGHHRAISKWKLAKKDAILKFVHFSTHPVISNTHGYYPNDHVN